MAGRERSFERSSSSTWSQDMSTPVDQHTAYQRGFEAGLRSIGALSQHLQSTATLTTVQSRGSVVDDDDEYDIKRHNQFPIQSEATLVGEGGVLPYNPDEKVKDFDEEKAEKVQTPQQQDNDPNIVGWDGPDDPENPMNWTPRKKNACIAILSALTFLTPLASSFFAPAVPQVMEDFRTHSTLMATFVVSVYVLGFAFGPLIIAPASEIYGRAIVYNITNVGFIIFSVGAALAPTMGSLIAFRFLQGCFGVTPITIGGGTLADMLPQEKRGAAMALWAMGPMLGPVVGPVAGGFLSGAEGWRWIFWTVVICASSASVGSFFILKETYAPVILQWKTKRLQKETGNMNLRSKMDKGLTQKQHYWLAIVRPAKLMVLSPICALMSLYMALVYGLLYLLFTTFTFVFRQTYHFNADIVGLVYLGMGIGQFLGLFILGRYSDKIALKLAKGNGGVMKPEYRLPMLIWMGPCIPIGLFIYGWTAQYKVQWVVPLLGTGIVGVGMMAVMMCINTYLVDTFTLYAASAMAANTILRSLFGGVFPLFGLKMYNALGLGWGNSLLGFIAIAMCGIPVVFYQYGERIRTSPRFQIKL